MQKIFLLVKLLWLMLISTKVIYCMKLLISIKTWIQEFLARKAKTRYSWWYKTLHEGRKIVLNPFKSKIFPLQPTGGSVNLGISDHVAEVSNRLHLKMLSPKQILHRLTIEFAQVKASNYIWKITKWNPSNNISFISCKRN